MNILFDLTAIYDHLTGIERYNINITKEIIKGHPEDNYILLFKENVHELFNDIIKQDNVKYHIIPKCNKLIFIQWRLYQVLKKIKADYYIFLSFTSPVLFYSSNRIINAIHDLTCWDCPESISKKMVYYYRYTYKVAAKRSWKLVTVSKFSQLRICEKYGLSIEKVLIIYDGLTDIFYKKGHINERINYRYGLPERYILSLSTIEPRKNLQLLIRAYKELMDEKYVLPDLVLAGREGWKLGEIFGGVSDNIKKKIHFTGFIEDVDLAQIYKEAELFVFPSKYEGFGLPIIEAMSQGTIVICSDAASLPEVSGGAGILFESNNVRDLKEKMVYALNLSEKERNEMIIQGRRNSQNYSWTSEAEKLAFVLHNG